VKASVRLLLLVLAAALLSPVRAAAGAAPSGPHASCAAPGEPVDPAILEKPTTIQSGIGGVSQKITTRSARAQAFFDQGLTYLHHYVWIEAARSFHEALRADADCAMCWMGLARAEQGSERGEAAAAAIAKAKSLARGSSATEREKCFIGLRALQIQAQTSSGTEERTRHAAYKEAIEKGIAQFPDDAELCILRGNAEEPGPWGRGQAGGVGSIAWYETALVRSPGHLGAHHYLVHSFENIGRHAEAAVHARIYAEAAPRVAHAQHMYGHVLPRLGHWQEALAQFAKADAIEEAYAADQRLRPGDDWHHMHNLQLLAYANLRLGRYADAEKTFRRAFATPARIAYRGAAQASLAEYLLLRGRLEEALDAASALAGSDRTPAARSAGAAVEGEVLLAMGRADDAKAACRRAKTAFEESKRSASAGDADYLDRVLGAYIQQLTVEIDLRGPDAAAAEDSLRKVADELAANPRFDAWGEGLFRLERIAEEAKRAGRSGLVADIYARMRKIDPDYVPGSTAISRQAARKPDP
jgi:tetratricopeptide (TPR) repeat protein